MVLSNAVPMEGADLLGRVGHGGGDAHVRIRVVGNRGDARNQGDAETQTQRSWPAEMAG